MAAPVQCHICPTQGGLVGGLEENCEQCAMERLLCDIDAALGELNGEPKCECGADKTYGEGNTFHQDYCPKFEGHP